jgi:hypothetical protein
LNAAIGAAPAATPWNENRSPASITKNETSPPHAPAYDAIAKTEVLCNAKLRCTAKSSNGNHLEDFIGTRRLIA